MRTGGRGAWALTGPDAGKKPRARELDQWGTNGFGGMRARRGLPEASIAVIWLMKCPV
jgi:hypothetical protein